MISLDQLRIIDPRLKDCPDEVLEPVRDRLYALGQFAFEEWLKERNRRIKVVPNPVRAVYSLSGFSLSGSCTL